MNETEFLALVEQVFDRIENQIETWAAVNNKDVDINRCGSNILTLTFDDHTQIVINSQAAVQEIWFAAPSGGFRYRYAGQHWVDTRNGVPLYEALSCLIEHA